MIVIPTAFGIFDVLLKRETQFTELSLVFTVMKTLILPMVIGMLLRRFAPAFSARFGDLIGKIAGILLIVSILPILIFILPLIWSLIGDKTVLAFVIFALAGGLSGYFLGGPDPHERTVLALATTSRHPAIAITLAAATLDDAHKTGRRGCDPISKHDRHRPFLKWPRTTKSEKVAKEAT